MTGILATCSYDRAYSGLRCMINMTTDPLSIYHTLQEIQDVKHGIITCSRVAGVW